MNSNRVKSRSGRHVHACAGMLALGFMLVMGCEQPSPPQQPQPPAVNAPPAPAPVVIVQKKAEVGVGEKGRGYGQGVIATPAASFWAVREKIEFLKIEQAMQLFKATEDRAPKDNDEFMEKIIKANNIHLPELPEGDRYMYDPKTEQLMVESPKPE